MRIHIQKWHWNVNLVQIRRNNKATERQKSEKAVWNIFPFFRRLSLDVVVVALFPFSLFNFECALYKRMHISIWDLLRFLLFSFYCCCRCCCFRGMTFHTGSPCYSTAYGFLSIVCFTLTRNILQHTWDKEVKFTWRMSEMREKTKNFTGNKSVPDKKKVIQVI